MLVSAVSGNDRTLLTAGADSRVVEDIKIFTRTRDYSTCVRAKNSPDRMVLRLGECELVSTGHVPYLEDTKIRSKIQSKIRRRYSTVKVL